MVIKHLTKNLEFKIDKFFIKSQKKINQNLFYSKKFNIFRLTKQNLIPAIVQLNALDLKFKF